MNGHGNLKAVRLSNLLLLAALIASPLGVAHSETALSPIIGLIPSVINFACLPLGATSDTTIMISNANQGPESVLIISDIQITGDGFSITATPPLPATLVGGRSAPMAIRIKPLREGAAIGAITIVAPGAANSPVGLPISGSTCSNAPDLPESATFESGLLIAYGHVLEPPYHFGFVNDTLLVNGFRLIPPLAQLSAPADSIPIDPSVMQFGERVNSLLIITRREVRGLLLQGAPLNEAMDFAVTRFQRSADIDHVEVLGENTIILYLIDPRYSDPIPYHFPLTDAHRSRSQPQSAHGAYTEIADLLESGRVVIYSSGGDYRTVPGADREQVLECIRLLRETGDAPGCGGYLGTFIEDLREPRPLNSEGGAK